MTGLPLGMAIHAAIVVCDGENTGIGVCRALEASLESPMRPTDSVLSHAVIREIGRRHVTCEAEAYAEEEPLRAIAHLAKVVLVRVENGKAVPLLP
jgi:acyl-CoA thioesterase FadM